MSSLVLVDSSFFIRLAVAREDPFDHLDRAADLHEFAICGVVWVEVLRGRRQPALRRRYEERFATMVYLNGPARTWQRTAALAWELDRRGQVIPATALAIAATALDHGAALLTFDRHFDHIPGLTLIKGWY
jgi:predicted nucleic acid-binding protein